MLETNVETVVNSERKIKVSSILIHTLLRWKIILIISLLAACIGGGREYLSEKQTIENNETIISDVTEDDHLLTNEQYDNIMHEFDVEIANRYKYIDDSIYAKINPYDFYTGYATFYIKSPNINSIISNSDENFLIESDDNVLMLLTALNDFVLYGVDTTELKQKLNISNDAIINELIYGIVENNVLRVNTYYDNEDDAEYLIEYLTEQIVNQFDKIIQDTGLIDYELIMLDRNTTSKVLSYNFGWYISRMTEIENLIKARGNFISNNSASSTVTNVVYTINKKAILKKSIIYGVIGMLASLFCIVALLFLSGKVMSYEELKMNYQITNICILNKRWHKKQASGIAKKIFSLEKEGKSSLSDENRLELAGNLIENLVPNAKMIGLIGDLDSQISQQIKDNLERNSDIKYVVFNEISDDLIQRKQMEKTDCLIMLVENERSKYEKIDDLLSLAKVYNKAIIGSIMC